MKRKNPFLYIGLAFSSYIVLSNILSMLGISMLRHYLPSHQANITLSILLSSAIQYLIAMPVTYLILKAVPSAHLPKRKVKATDFFVFFIMLYPIAFIGNIIGQLLNHFISKAFNIYIFNPVDFILNKTNPFLMLLLIGIIGPVIEEFMTRKLIIDKTIEYGEGVSLVLSATIFALIHGNFYQSFYAFGLGACFAYLYIKTGSIKCSSIMHIIINSTSVILVLLLKGSSLAEFSETLDYAEFAKQIHSLSLTNYLCILLILLYFIIYITFLVLGTVFLIKKRKTFFLQNGNFKNYSKEKTFHILFLNWGMLIFILVSIYTFVDNILMFAKIS